MFTKLKQRHDARCQDNLLIILGGTVLGAMFGVPSGNWEVSAFLTAVVVGALMAALAIIGPLGMATVATVTVAAAIYAGWTGSSVATIVAVAAGMSGLWTFAMCLDGSKERKWQELFE
ncbi:MAG: hypothetical protein P4L53_04040 [Candidatus Obscuribacterales bacterium]|nr:hypothetical protein [Candidatus Obscuribacterales bacterium]